VAHRTFAGNQSDSTSLVVMVESLRQAAGYPESAELLPATQVLVIVDAGVATSTNGPRGWGSPACSAAPWTMRAGREPGPFVMTSVYRRAR